MRKLPMRLLLLALCATPVTVLGQRDPSPAAVSPGEAGESVVIEGRCPTFIWSQVDASTGYELAVSEVASQTDGQRKLALRKAVPAGVFAWVPPAHSCLSPGRYAWAVRAQTAEGWSGWSKPRLFEVKAPGVTPEMRLAAEEVLGQWLAERRVSAAEAEAFREAPLSSPSLAPSFLGGMSRLPEPAAFTPVPCQAGSEVFSDVPASHPFCAWIQQLVRDGITAGCGVNPPRYCPDASVTRGQMAVFLERVLHRREQPEVEAGGAHTCGLLSNRYVVCWGDNSQGGQSTPPAGGPSRRSPRATLTRAG